ncbi:hypothetical protein AURDEDRAFT_141917 [Auricularia subglabra TFB-10046 SS5]|nr:hypothetical protein AURDEDRAFT_141917 [Auricularia subglabra TFB-10046 SS5]
MELILHHFGSSPFAERVRLVFGLKGLTWRSVDAELIMPKPKLTALTGGYRKTPVLQIGADIYCDSRLIVEELERRFPSPTLFPGEAAHGLSRALAAWTDIPLHRATAAITIGSHLTDFQSPVVADRQRFFVGFLDVATLPENLAHHKTQLLAHAALVNDHLSAGHAFWLGAEPSLADLHVYYGFWMLRTFVPDIVADLLRPFVHIAPWEARVAAIGHGKAPANPTADLPAEDAIAIARHAEPAPDARGVMPDPLGLHAGDTVNITPDDYGKEPVVGKLVVLTHEEVAVERYSDATGRVVVHFPRIGFRIERV